jgi:uncharacterized protein with HEPN domain
MHKNDLIRIRHMLDAAREATSFAADKTRADLDTDRMLTLSLVKCIEIIGEAASKVSPVCREECPRVPWPEITTMRHRLVHGYFDIDLDIVWQTVAEELHPLIAELEQVLGP